MYSSLSTVSAGVSGTFFFGPRFPQGTISPVAGSIFPIHFLLDVLKNPIGPSADVVASYKYISRQGRVDGYYAGNSLANRFGISTQVPRKPEIVSNNVAAKIKEISIGRRCK